MRIIFINYTENSSDTPSMNSFADNIIKRRRELGLSQKDIAEMSGVSLRTINALENGNGNPSIAALNEILFAIGYKLTITERVKND